ncbi:phage tail family protein [Staphylococcus borealis]|uniref:phage tail family protein n=1 Tax=Staphylococcus borealis TaxID=2742203 RepID=UPI002DBEE9B9|nr:phage tail family protein [Staphylococcus borealis]MEB7365444.1 phage tail family protein [Staphylococcus borealis]
MPFTLYNPNLNKLFYPKGLVPLDFTFSSIGKNRLTSERDGKPGLVDFGFDYREREIVLTFTLEHYAGAFDNHLLTSEIYGFFDAYEYYYLVDDNVPTRMIKIAIDEAYTPERYGYWYGKLEIKATVLGHQFFMSTYTTQEIEQYGYTAIVEKFGLADGINIELPNYSFKSDTFSVWNGGNTWIDYRNMDLKITVNNLKTNGNFQIQNLITKDIFIYNEKIDGKDLVLNGPLIYVEDNNILRNTNRQFIRLGPKKNDFKILNGIYDSIDFDFRYHFK